MIGVTLADRPDLWPQLRAPELNPGPVFVHRDPVGTRWWERYEAVFDDYRVALLDGDRVVAHGAAIPLCHPAGDGLPDTGWDFALDAGMRDHEAGRTPNVACALWIVVAPDARGTGLSGRMLSALREVTAAHGLDTLLAPVRPTRKDRYPLIPMAQYAGWRDETGAPLDPWLRVHVRAGGRIVGVCHRSMTVTGTVRDWERWGGLPLPASGRYVVPGALVPVVVDRVADTASYVEPNVWVRHDLTG